MPERITKKRSRDDGAKARQIRPTKKQRKFHQYHSSSDEAEVDDGDFKAVNLLDSDDEDLDNVEVDDVASSRSGDSSSDSESGGVGAAERPQKDKKRHQTKASETKKKAGQKLVGSAASREKNSSHSEADSSRGEASDDDDLEVDNDSFGDLDSDDEEEEGSATRTGKFKRNDPSAFATSISKILSTKLSTSKRADPVLARSTDAHEASRQVVDAALEVKARKQMREHKRAAMEKGRVRDVLVATAGMGAADADAQVQTTAELLETERRLRKTAQRGVVKMFNAVRAAQFQAAEAERRARADGVVGMGQRQEKVTEMSRKGFLDLIASGGGKLKKGGLEEA